MLTFILDNYDSFTYNLVQYLGELGGNPAVHRNDVLEVDDVIALRPDAVVVSPGPGVPADAGIAVPLIQRCIGTIPVLGVCLGHQALAESLGGTIVRAERQMHGKASAVAHTGKGLFRGIASPIVAMRYHSLIVDQSNLPEELEVTAWADDRPPTTEIMGLQHKTERAFGVQFHPESYGTGVGKRLLENFLDQI